MLTNTRKYVCVPTDRVIGLRDIGARAGITETRRAPRRQERADGGYITHTRTGRRTSYKSNTSAALADPIARQQNVGELLALLTHKPPEH